MNPTQNLDITASALADLTPADILRCAARYLELHGWVPTFYPPTAARPFPPADVFCAIRLAICGYHNADLSDGSDESRAKFDLEADAMCVLGEYLFQQTPNADLYYSNEEYSDGFISPDAWEEQPGRNAEQVIAALRAAADDYDWTHATEEQLETYAQNAYDHDRLPTREGFLAWLGAR